MEPKEYIPIAISSFSLIISATIAIKTYKLEKKREKRLNENLKLELKDSIILNDKQHQFYIFKIIVKNNSDMSNSIKDFKLNINYHTNKNISEKKTFILNYNYELDKKLNFFLPREINERNSVKLFGIFKLEKKFKEKNQIDDFEIIILDTLDNQYKMATTMIFETKEVSQIENLQFFYSK